MKKRIIALLMTAVMVVTMLPAMAFAEVAEPASTEMKSEPSTAIFEQNTLEVDEFDSEYFYYTSDYSYSDVKECNISDTSIAIVDHNYYSRYITIDGKRRGQTLLSVVMKDGTEETYVVNVNPAPFVVDDCPYNGKMDRGDVDYISVTDGFKEYTWSVDDESVIKLEDYYSYGYRKKITAVGKGEAMISVTNEFGDYTSYIVTVTAPEFTVCGGTNPSISVEVGDYKSLYLPYAYDWEDCTYEVADPSVAYAEKDSNCYLYGKIPGDTVMTVTNEYGETVECKIHVYKELTDLFFTEDEYVVWMGQTFQIPYVAEPENSNNRISFELSSWYDDIVSVTSDGIVTPLKVGTVYDLKIESESYDWDYCDIVVMAPYFTKESYVLYKNQTEQIELVGGRSDTTWTSSDESIATVSSTGEITAVSAGMVTITANTGGYEVSTLVDVINPTISKKTATVWAGKTLQLKVTGGVGSVKWTTSNKNVATVSSTGKVTAKKAGTATITANVSGIKLTCKVTVKGPELAVKKKTLIAKQTFKLNVNGATGKIVWSSSNKKVATVSSTGKITAVKAGTATIKAKVNGKTLSCKVTVKANQISYRVNLDVNQYPYGEPYVALKKAYYQGNTLKVDLWIINNKIFKCQKFDWIIYKLYDNNGKVIANKRFTNVKLNIPAGGVKKITLSFSGSALKQKNAILNNGVSDYWSYWFTYIID